MDRQINVNRILTYEYVFSTHIEYPFGAGCYYSVEWNEISEIIFHEHILNDDGKYHCIYNYNSNEDFYCSISTFEDLCTDMYEQYLESIKNESNNMNIMDELSLITDFSDSTKLDDTSWILFWVNYTHEKYKLY